jgi:hypothetical protein
MAFSFALLSAGSNKAARIAMMAMTTSSSMSVNASMFRCLALIGLSTARFKLRSLPRHK